MKIPVVIGATLLVLGQWLEAANALAALADPTRPASFGTRSRASAPKRGPVLQSTLVSPSRRIAIINGRTYGLGARVSGAVITEIRPYEVTLKRNGREIQLRFFPKLITHKTPQRAGSDEE